MSDAQQDEWGHVCDRCDGTGEDDPISGRMCIICNGEGWIECDECWSEEDRYDE